MAWVSKRQNLIQSTKPFKKPQKSSHKKNYTTPKGKDKKKGMIESLHRILRF